MKRSPIEKRSRKVLSRQINSGLCRLFLKICSHVEFGVKFSCQTQIFTLVPCLNDDGKGGGRVFLSGLVSDGPDLLSGTD